MVMVMEDGLRKILRAFKQCKRVTSETIARIWLVTASFIISDESQLDPKNYLTSD